MALETVCLGLGENPWRNRQGLPEPIHHIEWRVLRNAEFLFFQAYPAGIVWIGVNNGGNIALFEITFQLIFQFVATVIVHIKGFIFLSHYN